MDSRPDRGKDINKGKDRNHKKGGENQGQFSFSLPIPNVAIVKRFFGESGDRLPCNAHRGLLFDRYPTFWRWDGKYHSSWDNSFCQKKEISARHKFLQDFVRCYACHRDIAGPLLKQVHTRHEIICKVAGGESRKFTTQWRFVTGMGAAHPLENGFTFDRAVGVPYLPGSSVKGITRAWAITQSSAEKPLLPDENTQENEKRIKEAEKKINEILGSEESEKMGTQAAVGSVIFLDAYPVEWPTLEADVMTPHYARYYQKDCYDQQKGTIYPPSDDQQPRPIPFLTVGQGVTFRFIILPRTAEAREKNDMQTAMQWLQEGLTNLGAGDKTAAGYGYFEEHTPRTK